MAILVYVNTLDLIRINIQLQGLARDMSNVGEPGFTPQHSEPPPLPPLPPTRSRRDNYRHER